MTGDRVDPRPACPGRFGRRAVDRAEPGAAAANSAAPRPTDTNWAPTSSKSWPASAQVGHFGLERQDPRVIAADRAPPTRGVRRPCAPGTPHPAAACRPGLSPHPAPLCRRRPSPGCGNPAAAVPPPAIRRQRHQRRCAPDRPGRRRCATAAAQPSTGNPRRLPGRRLRTKSSRSPASMASASGASTRSSRPSRTTPSTMSGRCRGEPPSSVARRRVRRWRIHATGVSRSSIISTTLGVVVATPSSRPAVSEETTTESAPDCLSRCWFSASRIDATILALRCDLARGEGDQRRGVVAAGRDDDRRRVLGRGKPKDVGSGGVAVHGDQVGGRRVVKCRLVDVDDDEIFAGRLVPAYRGDGGFAFGAVADDDGVVAHCAPPTLNLPGLPGPLGEHLEGGADQHHEEQDPQRRKTSTLISRADSVYGVTSP